MQRISHERSTGRWVFAGILILFIVMLSSWSGNPPAYAAGGDWPTYQYSSARDGFNSSETIINPSSAPHLKLHWMDTVSGAISAQPVEANSIIYWGSWNGGEEHATDLNNNSIWETALGTTTDSHCYPSHAGVASTATVATMNGQSMLFVAGGNATFYALDAATGSIIWRTPLGFSPSHFLWSSPALFNGSIYEGVASFGDCPLVQGQMVQLDPVSGVITNIFETVPTGCVGGGVTGSPAIDEVAGTLYFATGNAGTCGSYESDTTAIVELNAADLSFVGAWQVPASQRGDDSDFLSTPTLFTSSGGTPMVGVANKNGVFYAFQRDALSNGPAWQTQIAVGGDCPLCNEGSISPAGWDGISLYVAGGRTTIGGTPCKGSVNALNPDNGNFLWRRCFTDGGVLGPVAVVPGVLVVGHGSRITVLATASGQTLYHFVDTTSGSIFYGGASISNGIIYIGNKDGRLFAIGT
jgi:outer membrane protein assembly factor BamB